jgi:hypothetical protein
MKAAVSKRILAGLAWALACTGAAAQVQIVETFESAGFRFLDAPLASGFQFGVAGSSSWFAQSEVGAGADRFAATSGTWLAFDDGFTPDFDLEDSDPISAPSPFVFLGAYFSGNTLGGPQVQVAYKLFDSSNSQVYESALVDLPANDSALFVSSGWSGAISKVVIMGHAGFYGMDDFTTTSVAVVPEPSAYLLMMLGCAVVGAAAKRRRTSIQTR